MIPPFPCITNSGSGNRGRKLVGQSTKVSRQHGLDERIDRRSAAAFELAHFAKDLAADRDVSVGPDLARDLGGTLLVCGIDVTVQKLKDNRLGAEFQQLLQGVPDLIFIERNQNPAARIHTLVDLQTERPVDQCLETANHSIVSGSCAPAQFQDVAEAARGNQAAPCTLAFEYGVGRDRGAVNDCRQPIERHPGFHQPMNYASGLVLRRRGYFLYSDLAALRLKE